ncbi:MAG: hypothetical protein L3K52_16665 [Candidatus Thiothrix sulfatifontis]|nr:MAG: hypothetical protein L3K52_16665 [Candidatus Thiothrix sulfatifontis]
MASTNRFGVSLTELQSLRDDMEKYHNQLEASGTLWKEAFKLQELEFEIEVMEKSINKAFDFVIENASTTNPRILSEFKRNKAEFNSLVRSGRIHPDEYM